MFIVFPTWGTVTLSCKTIVDMACVSIVLSRKFSLVVGGQLKFPCVGSTKQNLDYSKPVFGASYILSGTCLTVMNWWNIVDSG
jgi:hypothetical protein